MQRTENYRLFKPESTDNGSPEPFNGNADVIDAELNRLSTGLSRVDNALVAAQDVLESGITSAKVSKLDALPTSTQLDGSLSSKANKSDITNISITGTTNNTGSTIQSGTLFYLNGSLCKTLVDVANGATFTLNTNVIPYQFAMIQREIDVNYGKTTSVNFDVTNNTGNNATSLAELYNIISSNYNKGLKITYASIGNLSNTAIKNVIQMPFTSNYIDLYIKFEAGTAVASIYAVGAFAQKFAKCYLINDNTNIFLTDWQVLKQ